MKTKFDFHDRLSLNADQKYIAVQQNLSLTATQKADQNWFSGLIIT